MMDGWWVGGRLYFSSACGCAEKNIYPWRRGEMVFFSAFTIWYMEVEVRVWGVRVAMRWWVGGVVLLVGWRL